MTFDEWWDNNTHVFLNPNYIAKYVAKTGWNAAIEAAQDVLLGGDYYWPMENDYGRNRPIDRKPHAEQEIEQLKAY